MTVAIRRTSRELLHAAIERHVQHLLDVHVEDFGKEDDVVLRMVGWHLINSGDREAFRSGRKLLDKAANGRLHPPPHPRWWVGPSAGALDLAGLLDPYSVELMWIDGRPQCRVGGRLWVRDDDRDWRWYPLLHVDRHADAARTDVFWIRLGRRMHHAV
ncbi:hypothetical protein BJF92_00710 [Rhizobium rhizosphaerae]|uniref:Uncharacterized protein n=1 Tax=Xaviernesmea rhizosphaerae TaxID=1672749 RepID=A0A1Q9AEE4_9HYPH|nr:hypothetical protein [Xaviernesmea rhizosphaerae]OLP53322.1 hypothetical protein BJF92_00710 [Xaviernesmea rhizosphaerae]